MKSVLLACITALSLSGNIIAGSIYKCVNAAGEVSFSEDECLKNEHGGKIGYSAPPRKNTTKRTDPYSVINQDQKIKRDQIERNRGSKNRQQKSYSRSSQKKKANPELEMIYEQERCERFRRLALSPSLSLKQKRRYKIMAVDYCRQIP